VVRGSSMKEESLEGDGEKLSTVSPYFFRSLQREMIWSLHAVLRPAFFVCLLSFCLPNKKKCKVNRRGADQ